MIPERVRDWRCRRKYEDDSC